MATKEQAKASNDKQSADNKKANDKQKAQINNSKQSMSDNRGFNSKQTGSQKGKGYVPDTLDSKSQANLSPERKAQQQKADNQYYQTQYTNAVNNAEKNSNVHESPYASQRNQERQQTQEIKQQSQTFNLKQKDANEIPEGLDNSSNYPEKSKSTNIKYTPNDKRSIPGKEELFVAPANTSPKTKVDKSDYSSLVNAGHKEIADRNKVVLQKHAEQEFKKTGYRDLQKEGVGTVSPTPKNARASQKQFLHDAKANDVDFLRVKKQDGTTEIVPIEDGYRSMVANPNSTVSTVQNIPKGYAVGGSLGNLVFISTDKPKVLEEKTSTDPLSQRLKKLDEYSPYKPDDKIQGAVKPSTEDRIKFGLARAGVEFGTAATGILELRRSQVGINLVDPKEKGIFVQAPKPENFDEKYPKFYVAQTAPGDIIGSPFANGAMQSKSIGEFTNKTGANFNLAIAEANKKPIEQNIGEFGGFAATMFLPTSKLSKLSPISKTVTPIATSSGTKTLVTTIRVGYGNTAKVIGGKSAEGIFIGSQKKFGAIKEIDGATGRTAFETYEFADYSKRQLADLAPNIAYAEKEGVVGAKEFKMALEKGEVTSDIASRTAFPMKKEVIPSEIEKMFPGLEGKSTASTIATQQNKGNLFVRKGSQVINEIKGGLQTKVNDWDFIAKVKNPKKFNKLKKERDQIELKLESEQSGNVFFHGTNEESAKGILANGFDFGLAGTQTTKAIRGGAQRAEDITLGNVFAANNQRLASRFASSASTIKNKATILKIELQDNARIFKDFSFDPQKHQFENVVKYAKSKGYDGILKPIGSNPKNKELILFSNSPIKKVSSTKGLVKLQEKANKIDSEMNYLGSTKGEDAALAFMKDIKTKPGYVLEKQGTNIFIKNLKSGTKQEFANIITEKETRVSTVSSLGKGGGFFGKTFKQKTFTQKIEGMSGLIKTQDFRNQLIDWGRSTSGVISKRTLQNYKSKEGGIPLQNFESMFSKGEVARIGYALPDRTAKDFSRQYFFGFREAAKIAWKSGDKEFAKKIGSVMNQEYKRHSEIMNVPAAIKKVRAEETAPLFYSADRPSVVSSVGSAVKEGASSSKGGLQQISSLNPQTPTSNNLSNVKSNNVNSSTVKSSSMFSPNSSNPKYSSSKSFVSKSTSPRSTIPKSTSPKSVSLFSILSTSPKSTSPKSTSSKSSTSVFSPKPSSSKSSSSSSSSKSSSSVFSPKSSSSKSSSSKSSSSKSSNSSSSSSSSSSPFSSKSVFSPAKQLPGKSLHISSMNPNRPVAILNYSWLPKSKKTVRPRKFVGLIKHSVFNPFNDKYSINEGKTNSVNDKLRGWRYTF